MQKSKIKDQNVKMQNAKMKNRNEKFDELMQEAYMKAIKYRQLYRLRILKARREVENGKQKTL